MNEHSARNVADEVAESLRSCGIENLFMLTGGDQPFWIALRKVGIRMTVARSEASAVYMADGYARAAGRPVAAYGQAGPGAANVAAALADAFWAQSPVVALTGSTASTSGHAIEYQDIDQSAMFAPVTKWNGAVGHASQTGRLVRQAIKTASAGTAGPTHLDIPKDFFGAPASQARDEGSTSAAAAREAYRSAPQPGIAGQVIARLGDARRAVLLVGEGARLAEAGESIARFSDLTGIPILATMGGKPAVLSTHPNFGGIVGRYSAVTANRLLADADCVLAVGTRLGGLATNGYKLPAAGTDIIQVDRDPLAFVNVFEPSLRVQADIGLFFEALLSEFSGSGLRAPSDWQTHFRAETVVWLETLRARTADQPAARGLSPLVVVNELGRYASEIVVVADTGYMAAWTGVLFPVLRYNAFFRAVGSLGWALPASLGVQMARQEKVVCVIGDGGVGYHLADIETAVRYRLSVVILVLNNSCLAFEYHEQKYRWNGNVVAEANDLGPADYALAAQALGAAGRRAATREDFCAALAEAMAADGPFVIDVVTDKEAFPPVTNFDAVLQRTL